MSDYTPPKVWTWDKASGGKFANINRPISGATKEAALEVGKHPHQLYSLATPNGVKVTVMLEELLEAGIKEAEYDAYIINIGEGDQFGSDFVAINPNSKIPAMMDHSTTPPTYLWPFGRGTAHWLRVNYMRRQSFCLCMSIKTSFDGKKKLSRALPCSADVW